MRNLITCLSVCVLSGATFAETWTVDDGGDFKADFDQNQITNENGNFSSVNQNYIHSLDNLDQKPCISIEERALVNKKITEYQRSNTWTSSGLDNVLTFFPMGGRLYHDIFTNNFVDLDPSTGLLDWDCTNHTYDGHRGNDTGLKTFTEQIIGVPAFSAMDGVVVYAHDGEPDMNTECQGIGNAVVIHHGNDLYGYYWHFKNGSVSVAEGEVVTAGQQIAEIASSGCSTGPHLHFELRNHEWFEGETIEPYIGECHLGESMWEEQVEIERALYFADYGIARTHFDTWPSYPYRYPNDRQFLLNDSHQYYWILMHNLPAKGAYSWKWYKPDGTLSYESNGEYDNEVPWRIAIWRFFWNISDMHQYPGTWHVSLDINGTILDMYPEIVEELDATFNNAPNPIQIEVLPTEPLENDVLECNVLGSLTNDDPDRDVIRYRYIWEVNGTVVRDTVSAAKKDVLAWDIAFAGDNVTVFVTPNDGIVDGVTSTIEVAIFKLWTVDDDGEADFNNIQDAIHAANDGHEIIVAPGTYTSNLNEVVDMLGKEIWLHSSGGSEVTFINGENARRGMLFENGESEKTIIEGFTFINGYTLSHGGGVRNTSSSPTIQNCVFQDNYSALMGGGLFSSGSQGSLTIKECTFTGNSCVYGGGGMRNSGGNTTLENCTFIGNTSYEYGGGMNNSAGGNAAIINCIFKNNTASYGGGGIRNWTSNPTLIGTTVCNNMPNQITGDYTDGGGNTISEECPIVCPDVNGDEIVNINDLLAIIAAWDIDCDGCSEDVNNDANVNVSDLLIVVGNWGPCE